MRAKHAHVDCMWQKCQLDLRKAGGVQGRHKGFNLTSAHQKMAARIRGLSLAEDKAGQSAAKILSGQKRRRAKRMTLITHVSDIANLCNNLCSRKSSRPMRASSSAPVLAYPLPTCRVIGELENRIIVVKSVSAACCTAISDKSL